MSLNTIPRRKVAPPTNEAFYALPYLGQPFKRVQNETVVEYGYCNGLKETGRLADGAVDWTATISSGVSGTFRIYPRMKVGTDGWTPLTGEEIAAFRGTAVLGDVVSMAVFNDAVDKLSARIAVLEEERLAQDDAVAELSKGLRALVERVNAYDHPKVVAVDATPSTPPPVAAQSNGRGGPQRVPRVG
jgi:hypothetical protein